MKKFKNPTLWVTMITLVFAAAGVDFETLTSWTLLIEALKGIISNPVSIAMVLVTAYGIYNDNSTKGIDKL